MDEAEGTETAADEGTETAADEAEGTETETDEAEAGGATRTAEPSRFIRRFRMPTYSIYGLTVDSDVRVPFLEPIRADAQIRIRRGAVAETPTADPDDGRTYRTPTGLYAAFSGVGTLHASGGETLVVDAAAGVAPRLLRQFVLGQGFRMLLHQRGYLVLHASAVVVDGHAVGFLGDSGQGKSTVAAACDAAGYPVVTDDVLAVDPEAGTVRPGVPAVKLARSTAEAISGEFEDSYSEFRDSFRNRKDIDSGLKDASGRSKDNSGRSKDASGRSNDAAGRSKARTENQQTRRYRPVAREAPADSIPLAGLYVLADGPDVRTARISPAARPYHVMCGSISVYGSGDEPAVERHFADCLRLCTTVPVERLERPRRTTALPALVSEVTAPRNSADAPENRGDDG